MGSPYTRAEIMEIVLRTLKDMDRNPSVGPAGVTDGFGWVLPGYLLSLMWARFAIVMEREEFELLVGEMIQSGEVESRLTFPAGEGSRQTCFVRAHPFFDDRHRG